MNKIHYDSRGWVCNRYPYNIPIEDETRFIEVEDDEYDKTLQTLAYYAWRVVDGHLVNEEYTELSTEQKEEKRRLTVESEIAEHKKYLADTDCVITKLTEAQATGDEEWLNDLRTQYAYELLERKRRRNLINELEKSL